MIALLLTGAAFAAPVEFCIEIPTNFINVVEADYYTFNTDRAMRGVRIAVSGAGSSQYQYASWTGSDAGCATFDIDVTQPHDVLAFPEARVDNRRLRSLGGGSANPVALPPVVVASSWSGTSTGLYSPTNTYQVPADGAWHALNMAGNVFSRYDYNVSTSFEFELAPWYSSSASGTQWHPNHDYVYAGVRDVLQTTRNLGYAILIARDEGNEPVKGQVPNNGCYGSGTDSNVLYGNDFLQKRWAGDAAVQAFSDYVSVMTFNNRGTNKCIYRGFDHTDFDQDDTNDTNVTGMHFSCEHHPLDMNADGDTDDLDEELLDVNITAGDWLETGAAHLPRCTYPLQNRSTKYDWLRFLWDLSEGGSGGQGEGNIHPDNVASILDVANPKHWATGGGDPQHPNKPAVRFTDACDTLGYTSECDLQLFNGITHGTGWP